MPGHINPQSREHTRQRYATIQRFSLFQDLDQHSMTTSIRLLTDTDFESADEILKLAFGGFASRIHELRLYRQMQPDGWFLALQEERPVGMVGAINYGAFAYIGLMAVHPNVQRQGVGLALMQFLLARLDQQHIPLVLLDASKAGRPLYEKLGFVSHDESLAFQRDNTTALKRPSQVQLMSAQDLDELAEWDATFFGANRRKVLQALLGAYPERAFMLRNEAGQVDGYLFAQKNRIGPWIMRQPYNAEALLQAALSLPYDEKVSVVVPSVNQEAVDLLGRYGFEQGRSNRHMMRGLGGHPSQRRRIHAQTSFAVG
jgi:predicted N-acetyltransferase YhbS